MPKEIVFYMTQSKDKRQRMQFEIIWQCAPFLKGMKAASILNIDKCLVHEMYLLIKNTNISCRILVVKNDRCLVMFYRKEELWKIIDDAGNRAFLREYGYDEQDLEKIITRLSVRIKMHSREEVDFPHEIGVFLDYPLNDVKAFIVNRGRNSIFTGYWKVYNNLNKARMKFFAYDRAKDSAVNEFLAGRSFREIAE